MFFVDNWQTIDLTTMVFPAEMLVDYVRVYQRSGATNIGCNPKAYPTSDYISAHLEAYQSQPCSWFCGVDLRGLILFLKI